MFGKKKDKKEEGDGADGDVEMQDQNADDKNQEQSNEVGEMRRGDYMIHVFIEKGKEFDVPENSTIDPMI
jgi:hypothetical protein